jgi:two-component system, OmpR family, sensor kinase
LTVRVRLLATYTAVLLAILTLSGVAVAYFSDYSVKQEIDRGLQATADQIREQTRAYVLGDVAVLSGPEGQNLDVFESATSFYVIISLNGEVVAQAKHLSDYGYNEVLDPAGLVLYDRRPIREVGEQNRAMRVLTDPLYAEVSGERVLVGYLQVAHLLDDQNAVMEQLRLIIVLTSLAGVCLSLLLGAWVVQTTLKPLDDIAEVALEISQAGDLSRRLTDTGRRDEIGRLTMVLNQTLERLERLFHSRQRFLADVSHELRTPLTTIRGNVDLMRRMNEADPEVLDVVQEELERMTRLVEDLMLLARADSGGLPIQQKPVELDTVFLDIYRQVLSINQPVRIVMEEVDQACVLGDSDRLKQLILNLVDNAIKYTPIGGEVTMSLTKGVDDAKLVVHDTGIGIPTADLPYIFDRFYRVDKARTRAQGGSGLGLSIAKWIAEAHGGKIDVSSVPGQGSTFTVSLPLLPDQHRQRIAQGSGAPAGRPETAPGQGQQVSKVTV